MKKLLVLALVMGIASLASAALTITAPASVAIGEEFTVTVSSDTDYAFDGGVYGDGAALVTATADLAAAGDAGIIEAPPVNVYGGYELSAAGVSVLPTAGDLFTLTATATEAGTYTFDLLDYAIDYYAPVASASVTVIPEPATMVLLGLGALVMRRKK